MTAFSKKENSRFRFITALILAALSGALLLFSFQPYGFWFLAWVAFIPMLFAQYRLLPQKWSSIAPAVTMGIWLGFFLGRIFGPEFGPVFQYMGILIALLSFLMNRERGFHESTGYRWFVLHGIIDWVGFEMIRATVIPLMATNGFIGYTQAAQPWLIQPVSVFGIYGLDLLILLVNFSAAQGVIFLFDRKRGQHTIGPESKLIMKWLAAAGIILIGWTALSAGMYFGVPEGVGGPRVASLRPNFPEPAFQDDVYNSEIRVKTITRQIREAAALGAEIIYTPEMLFDFDPRQEYTETFSSLAKETGAYIFIGYAVVRENEPFRNEVVLLTPDGEFLAAYAKNHAPPGEPLSPSSGAYHVYRTPLGTLSTAICHDINYTDVTRKLTRNGAVLTGAAFREFGGYGEQMWTHAVFRAVETRTSMVVTGTANASAVIDSYGNLVALNVDARGSPVVLTADVSLGSGETPYLFLGDFLGWISLAGYIAFIVFQSITKKKRLNYRK